MADNRDERGEEADNPESTISNAGHPLLNQVVASTLFEVVKLADLRSLRLVCKDLYSLSLPIWRRNVQINIHARCDGGTTPPPRSLLWETLGTGLDDVVGDKPFRHFRLHSSQFLTEISRPCIVEYTRKPSECPPNFEGTYRNMERFWGDYGHWIHKLEFKDAYVADWDAFKRAIFEQTPNLQELTLNSLMDGREWDGVTGTLVPLPIEPIKEEDEGPPQPNLNLKVFAMKDCYSTLPFGWRLLFNRFPNIEKLELPEHFRCSDSDEMVEGLENMLLSTARRPNLLITDLRLRGVLDSPFERLNRNPLVKLKVLHYSLSGHSDKDVEMIQTVMHHHRDTLKELRLRNYYPMPIDFSESDVVPYVSLTELQFKGLAPLALNFHFLQKFPNLKVLRLKQFGAEQMLDGTNWTVLEIMPHLREFSFIVTESDHSEEDFQLSEEDLERFTEVMPNLECFTGQLTNLTLRVVCRTWRRLKKLVILSGRDNEQMDPPKGDIMDIDDVGITGIISGSDERVPCVADLQELRLLTLEHVTLIGTASVFGGFLKLPHLSSLDICETNKISKEGVESLKRRLQEGLTITPLGGLSDTSD